MRMLRCGMIGENIGRSKFPKAIALLCARHGLALDYRVDDTRDRAGSAAFDFEETVASLAAEGRDGVTVTHPFKTHAARWAGNGMDAEAAHLGAANTLLFATRRGTNTDYCGFRAAWAETGLAPGRVAAAGAGGVARAVVPALAGLGAEVSVWDVDRARADALGALGATSVPIEAAEATARAADGLVNCTPLGHAPDMRSAFDPAWIGPQSWAFDAVYTPIDTPFLTACASAGLRTLTGFDLFRHMVLRSFEAYTGIADPEAMPLLEELRP
ncbi:shikimate dehydrogenase [Jannaschia sp. Os4]|uniref:shikimate dehydrogenase family protein n=1 Tax=Jannaschia sp. Os4 TaxID=2807617 RepID=UPI0019398E6F|nr:shikimate dehydrogenase [Jannaschia sp. Os4]MBM2577835.1 shikimate dehydrogenase [Jannaschia sp. Os4]